MSRSKCLAALAAATLLSAAAGAAPFAFVPGDLVLSLYGNVDGASPAGDNQASPISLTQITTAGAAAGQLILPQVTIGRQSAISGEYGSSSEGFLQQSADGRSLTIMGYGVNAKTYNAGGAAVYGNAALAQTTSVQGGAYTAVSRVVALVGADGSVDTSTALYNMANTNNPRSAVTVDGSGFYVSGQGVKGDTTQGVFYAAKGATAPTAIDTSIDTRDVGIANGQLYVTADSKQNAPNGTYIASYGGLPGGATTAVPLSGIGNAIAVLTAAQANGVNKGRIGNNVYLSPEQFFFANATTLYIADSGAPKNGDAAKAGLGDGGLQKWVLANGSWSLAYTLSSGLNLVAQSAASGTTGLFGLTGALSNGVVSLYATSSTVGDLDQSFVYSITDQLSATAQPTTAFSTIYTAAAGTKVKGIAFAPSAITAVPEPAAWMTMLAGFGAIGAALRRRRAALA